MKTKKPVLKPFALVASVLFYCALRLPAQTPPTITTQPASQTNLAGANVTFSVTVAGTGPYTYQWQLNGVNLPNNIITTVAGNGVGTNAGDGGTAINASLQYPRGVAFDAVGNLYIADQNNNRIRKVDTSGVITTVAGTGTGTYAGDGGAATNASLFYPTSVALDAAGNLYISDLDNGRVRKVDTTGIITTVATFPAYGPVGVALDAAGNLYVADQYDGAIFKVNTNGAVTLVAGDNSIYGPSGDGGPALAASLAPQGVAFDAAGNLYIADEYHRRIRVVNSSGIISTVAGNGANGSSGDGGAATNASLCLPYGVALDASGNLYIADYYTNRIRRVDTNGIITTVAGNGKGTYAGDGGAATNASLCNPACVALDAAGNLYIADYGNNRIREVHFAGYPTLALTNVSAGNAGSYTVVVTSPYGSVTSAVATLTLAQPASIVVEPASQAILPGSNATLSVTATGTPPLYYSWYFEATNLQQSGANASFMVNSMSNGNAGQYTVVVTNAYGSVTSQVATLSVAMPPTITAQPGSQTNLVESNATFSVAVAGTGPFTYQWRFNGVNLANDIITTVAGNGSPYYSGDGGQATNAGLKDPKGVALDDAGDLFFADQPNQRIRIVGTDGIITTVAGNGQFGYLGDNCPATSTLLCNPFGVALDAAGNLYIADSCNNRIRKVDINGIITTVAGNGTGTYAGDGGAAANASLNNPCAVALDIFGNLFIADNNNNRIRKVDLNGMITTVAGNGTGTYAGDGGAATNASLNTPISVAVDAAGNLYIADSSNNRIRRVDTNGIMTTVAGNGSATYAGDGGAATNASLNYPCDVVLDAAGNLYIADTSNNRMRQVDTNGIISTVAGSGISGYSGDGGEATNAALSGPFFAALHASGILFIADTGNNRIREVDIDGIPTLALTNLSTNNDGNYSVVITSPYGTVTSSVASLTVVYAPFIVVQPANQAVLPGCNATLNVAALGAPPPCYSWYFNATNLVQTGTNSSLIVPNVSTSNTGQYTVVVTNAYGSVTSSVATLTIAFPPSVTTQLTNQTALAGSNITFSVAAGGTGPFNYQWQFNGTNLPTNIIATVAGGALYNVGDGVAATSTSLYLPSDAAFDAAGNLYIADSYHNRIRVVGTNGVINTVAGGGSGGDGGPATNAALNDPWGVALDTVGNLYIAEVGKNRIRKVNTNGIITTPAGNGDVVAPFDTINGTYSGDGGPATNAGLNGATGVILDGSGNLYIADTYNNRIRKVDTTGIITTIAGNGGQGYSGDGAGAANATLNHPFGLCFDSLGSLYIADSGNNVIRKVDIDGIINTVAGNGSPTYAGDGGPATNAGLSSPNRVALDTSESLYIADGGNNRIRKVDTNGIITTVAGNGSGTYAGDGGAATNASLYCPWGVVLDAAQNMYIVDTDNNRIREVCFAGHPVLSLTDLSTNNAGNCAVVITTPYGSVTSAVAALTVVLPPAIVVQPASQGVVTGSNAIFSVTATGTTPLCYSWYFNATNLVQSGANAPLTVSNSTAANAGSYWVVVTNAWGSVTSGVAILTIAFPPSMTTQPASQAAQAGSNVSFSITAAGTGPFSYQWQFNGANLSNNIISTVAGMGAAYRGFFGDGGAATSAELNYPFGVALDGSGNLYVADCDNGRIRKVDSNGIITTVAGNGTNAYAGDGGPATSASLSYPQGVALDAGGNLYIADTDNNRIRKVDTNGNITTVAGTNGGGYSGDGGPAINARIYGPTGVVLDVLGNLYIADYYNQRIRKVDTNGIITTMAGTNSAGYSGDGGAATYAELYGPTGVALDVPGNLYIADYDNCRVRKVDTSGIITTVAGNGGYGYSGDGGAATNAAIYGPSGVAVDALGDLYIADVQNFRIRKVDTNGVITTVAGNGTRAYSGNGGAPTNAALSLAYGVALDAVGNLYIADTYNQCIRKVLLYAGYPSFTLVNVSPTNVGNYSVVISNAYGCVTSAVATLTVQAPPIITIQPVSQIAVIGSSAFFSVEAVGSGPFGYLLYFGGTNLVQSGTNSALTLSGVSTSNAGNYTVVVTNAWGAVTSQAAALTVALPPSVTAPPGSQSVFAGTNVTFSVTAAGTGPFSYVWQFNGASFPTNIITTVAGCGSNGYAGDGGAATSASLGYPSGVALDGADNLYIGDYFNNRIRKVDTNGIITTVAGNGTNGYSGDGGAATNASLSYPGPVALDASGNLYIAAPYNHRIRKADTNGIITTVAGNGVAGFSGDGGPATNASLLLPCGVALDPRGNLYISDADNNRIRKVDTHGIITTVAGNGVGAPTSGSYSGDGGPATSASLHGPVGVALDASGNLYIADGDNDRIRKVDIYGIIITVAGNGGPGYSGDGGAATNAGLTLPSGVALDEAGNLYIAGGNQIRKVDSNGIISSVAGQGLMRGYSGDGGPATNATLSEPSSVAVDALGNLYIADSGNYRVREVNLAGYPVLTLTNVSATNAGSYSVVVSSPWGGVTSAVATLTVTIPSTPPQIITWDACFGFLTNQFGFNVSASVGQTIVVDGSTDLVNWTPLCTNTVGASAVYFCDPCWTNFGWRFYRARLP